MESIRATLAALTAERAKSDPHLSYLDGRELFGPADADHLPDNLHPDPVGYRLMGERFVRLTPGFSGR